MKWIEVFDDDYFHIKYAPNKNLMYISYCDGLDFEEIQFRFPFLNFFPIIWEKVYKNIAFNVEYDYSKKLLRVVYLIHDHLYDEIFINFDPKCVDCKYFNAKGDKICCHPNSDSCKHGELWRVKEKANEN